MHTTPDFKSRSATDNRNEPEIMLKLIEAALGGDQASVRQLSLEFARTYRGADQPTVQARVHELVRRRSMPLEASSSLARLPLDSKTRSPLIEEYPWPDTALLLEQETEATLQRFTAEVRNADRLSSAGLGSRSNLLLSGPPGTGKTFIAAHIAARLRLPFHVVRLDAVVSSLLGDTAKNIRAMFDYAREGARFLFLDEIDALAKRRDDERELGELKRVVNTLIQGLDTLDPRTVIVAATNHEQLLDPAIWRRFPYTLRLGLPRTDLRSSLWGLYLAAEAPLAVAETLGRLSEGLSCSDIRELAFAARRDAVLQNRPVDIGSLAVAILRSTSGRLVMPGPAAIEPRSRPSIMAEITTRFRLPDDDVARLFGVTRQAVGKARKRASDEVTSVTQRKARKNA